MYKKKQRKPPIELGHVGKPKITKIEVAVHQLETAIDLWFSDRDVPSITTLGFASHEVLFRLNEASPSNLRSLADPDVAPEELRPYWHKLFRLDYDFCRHAGTDPNEPHFFSVGSLHLVLLDAVFLYERLGFSGRLNFHAFKLWVLTIHPKAVKGCPDEIGLDPAYVEECRRMGKFAYFEVARRQYAADHAAPGSPVKLGAQP